MSKKFKAFCIACCLVALTPVLATYSDLQVPAFGWAGQTVTVTVHNPTSGPVSARVRVPVQCDEGIYFLLTSANFTVAGGATTTISLSAPQPVMEIEDAPEPIGAL